MSKSKIVKTPGIVGGRARIDGTRISVKNVIERNRFLGSNSKQIAESFGISVKDVSAALNYFENHKLEIENSIKEHEDFVRKFIGENREQISAEISRR